MNNLTLFGGNYHVKGVFAKLGLGEAYCPLRIEDIQGHLEPPSVIHTRPDFSQERVLRN